MTLDAETQAVVVLGVFTVAYVVYHYAASAAAWQKRGCGQTEAVLRQRWAGAFIFAVPAGLLWLVLGAGPLAIIGRWEAWLAFIGFVSLVSLPSIAAASKKPKFADDVPLIREFPWSPELKRSSALSWVAYLFGYELMFRGALLFGLNQWVGPVGATAIVTAIYVAVHLPKPWPETVGCIPMGVAFAAASLYSGSFLPAFVGHTMIALFSDARALKLRAAG